MQPQRQTIDLEEWMAPRARAERKAKSLAARLSPPEVAEFARGAPLTLEEVEKISRNVWKLEALIKIAKRGFNKRFKQVGRYRYVMVE